MVTIGLYYDVIAGKGKDFEGKFKAVVDAMQGMPGHKLSYLYHKVDDADSYLIVSEWDDQETFLAFIRSDAFKSVTTWGRENVLRGPPRHKIYPRSEDIGRPPAGH